MIENHEPIWFTNEPRNTEQNSSFKPHTILVATPVHSDVSMHYTHSPYFTYKSGVFITMFE
jgi:hypothetical protein